MDKQYITSRCHVGMIRGYDFGNHITLDMYSNSPHSSEYKSDRLWLGSVNRNGSYYKLLMDYLRNSDDLKYKLIWTEIKGSEFFKVEEKHLNELAVIIDNFVECE